ncbi:hypothetical protein V8E51_006720 [Hyaloscypha variabilis]
MNSFQYLLTLLDRYARSMYCSSDEDKTSLRKLSRKCQAHLFDIAVLFHDMDWAVMREITFDRAFYLDSSNKLEKRDPRLRTQALFSEECPCLQPFEQAINDRAVTGHTIHNLEIGTLIDTTFNSIWALAATSLFEFQGPTEVYQVSTGLRKCDPFAIAKERARNILDTRYTIMDLLEGLEGELVQQNLGYIWSGIRSRVRSLDGFEGVYNRDLGRSELGEPSEKRKKQDVVSIAYQQGQQNPNATLIAVVFATTVLGFIPIIFAWHRAIDLTGSAQDADSWLLIQSSIMQLVGLFTAMFPISRQAKSHAWIYALLSFLSSTAQAGMALSIALMVDAVTVPQKEE